MFWSRHTLLPLVCLLASCADPFIESTSLLTETPDSLGPYQVSTVVIGSNARDRIELFYNPIDRDPTHFIPVVMDGIDNDGRSAEYFVGQIPAQIPGSTIRYFVAVDRDGERVAEDPVGGDLRPFMLRIVP